MQENCQHFGEKFHWNFRKPHYGYFGRFEQSNVTKNYFLFTWISTYWPILNSNQITSISWCQLNLFEILLSSRQFFPCAFIRLENINFIFSNNYWTIYIWKKRYQIFQPFTSCFCCSSQLFLWRRWTTPTEIRVSNIVLRFEITIVSFRVIETILGWKDSMVAN